MRKRRSERATQIFRYHLHQPFWSGFFTTHLTAQITCNFTVKRKNEKKWKKKKHLFFGVRVVPFLVFHSSAQQSWSFQISLSTRRAEKKNRIRGSEDFSAVFAILRFRLKVLCGNAWLGHFFFANLEPTVNFWIVIERNRVEMFCPFSNRSTVSRSSVNAIVSASTRLESVRISWTMHTSNQIDAGLKHNWIHLWYWKP